LGALAAGNPPNALQATVEQRRAALTQLMQFAGPETPVGRIEDRTIPGPAAPGPTGPGPTSPLPVRIYTPLEQAADALLPGLIYFHGGGLVAGTVATHDSIARALASAGACRVVSVEYRLAPEHRFPAALEDALAAVNFIGAHAADFGIDGAKLGICGDSAGGTLAAATAQALAHADAPLRLALQVLICPILDYSRMTDSRRELAQGFLVDQATLDHDLLHYVPAGTDTANPRISPLRASDLKGLPRTIIHTAEFDPLRDEGRHYFERLAHSGVAVSYTCHAGMIHLFYGLGAVIPYAKSAFAQIGGEIRAALA